MHIKGQLGNIEIGDHIRTRLMAIMNLSPNSFFKGSIKQSKDEIQSHLERIIEEGADFIDVGAISSAPAFLYNSKEKISESTEIDRLSYFFKVYKEMGVNFPISVDTQSSITADYALSQGATIINDISGFKSDSKLPHVVSEYSASAIIMACRRVPGDVFSIREVFSELDSSLRLGINAGIEKSRITIDPGLGSWVPQRQIESDYSLIINLAKFRDLEHCILVGISRKSFIGKILNNPPEERLWGSLAATTVAIMNGAHIIRTHDVKATKDVCLITDYIKNFRKKASL
ncbi:MAG: dihydropteroate synthase [Candidatus Heimdallarchaeota archaeon]|nr:MAG: dihydropteroate synthase [Candidatus Heimdallarchaeota archaeon]